MLKPISMQLENTNNNNYTYIHIDAYDTQVRHYMELHFHIIVSVVRTSLSLQIFRSERDDRSNRVDYMETLFSDDGGDPCDRYDPCVWIVRYRLEFYLRRSIRKDRFYHNDRLCRLRRAIPYNRCPFRD